MVPQNNQDKMWIGLAFIQLVWFTKRTRLEALPIKIFATFASSGNSRFDLEMCQKESMDAEWERSDSYVAILIISICCLCPDSRLQRGKKKKKKKISCWVYYSWTHTIFGFTWGSNLWVTPGDLGGLDFIHYIHYIQVRLPNPC